MEELALFIVSTTETAMKGRERKKRGKCDFSSSLLLLFLLYSLFLFGQSQLFNAKARGPTRQRLLNVSIFLNVNVNVNVNESQIEIEIEIEMKLQLKFRVDPTIDSYIPNFQ